MKMHAGHQIDSPGVFSPSGFKNAKFHGGPQGPEQAQNQAADVSEDGT